MLDRFIRPILWVTGCVTMLPILQFLIPETMLASSGLKITEAAGLYYAQHWGLVVFSLGGLLVYAAKDLTFHRPVMVAAVLEKVGLVGMNIYHWNNPVFERMHIAALFDGLCICLYLMYLLQKPKAA